MKTTHVKTVNKFRSKGKDKIPWIFSLIIVLVFTSSYTLVAQTNTQYGVDALKANTTGYGNAALGYQSLYRNTVGYHNVANGFQALYSNTTGYYNTATGVQALYSNTTGYNNTANGLQALSASTSGINNTANGFQALYSSTTGSNNTAYGYRTGSGITTGSGNTIIGANVTGLPSNLSNTIILADGNGNQRLYINGNGNVGISTTSPSFELDVKGMIHNGGSDFILGKYDGRPQGSLTQNRALVHEANDILTINYGGDFEGGVVVNGPKATFSGNVGIGTTNPENSEGWDRVLEITGSNHAKALVSSSNVKAGIWSHNTGIYYAPAGGITGTWSNHPFSIMTNRLSRLTIDVNGNIGIGTASPVVKLQLVGDMVTGSQTFGERFIFHSRVGTGGEFLQITCDDATGNWQWGKGIAFVRSTGNVGIGTSNPTQKLSVNGTIQAKEIIVNTGWSDFVFDNNYKLRPLTEVEQFVKTNKHLPEIPSQKEVEKNGVQLGDISSKLLMKIEELTLYMIDMKKENEKQKAININLENQIKKLQNK